MDTMQDVFTRADYDLLPEGFPAQLIEGFLVKSPAPTYGHQRIVQRLLGALSRHIEGDRVLPAPTDVILDDYNVFQPDVVVFREQPLTDGCGEVLPLVCFEVISPATEERDRRQKLPCLPTANVEEVWLLDLSRQTIEVHDPKGRRKAVGDESAASKALPGFTLVPEVLYAPPRG